MPAVRPTKNGSGIDDEREDQPAEEADAEHAEDEPEDEHGGYLRDKEVTVAPSTTTTARPEV